MIAIVDYKAGNLTSVKLAFEAIGVEAVITDRPETILQADRVVFPGVGAAGASMRNLSELNLVDALRTVVARGTPFLGICVGMQVLFDRSEEDGGTPTLGFIPGEVRLFRPVEPADKVPQIGWNAVRFRRSHPVFAGVESETEFYFVHSYYPTAKNSTDCVGTTDYAGVEFTSVVGRDNLVATQFHIEKSGRVGLKVFENFSRWDGQC
ncbi:MAG: imidazole glycerol phosphate synthase subunit HisH [bacterium]